MAPNHCERFVVGPIGVVLPDVVGFASGLIDDVGRWNGNVGESLLDELGGVQGRIGPDCRLVSVVLSDGDTIPVNLLNAITPPFSFSAVKAEIEVLLFSVFANADVLGDNRLSDRVSGLFAELPLCTSPVRLRMAFYRDYLTHA